jgi:hypothetical protein
VLDEVISAYMKYFSYEKTGLCCVFMAGCEIDAGKKFCQCCSVEIYTWRT